MVKFGTLEQMVARVEERFLEVADEVGIDANEVYLRALVAVGTLLYEDETIRVVGKDEKGDPIYAKPDTYIVWRLK